MKGEGGSFIRFGAAETESQNHLIANVGLLFKKLWGPIFLKVDFNSK